WPRSVGTGRGRLKIKNFSKSFEAFFQAGFPMWDFDAEGCFDLRFVQHTVWGSFGWGGVGFCCDFIDFAIDLFDVENSFGELSPVGLTFVAIMKYSREPFFFNLSVFHFLNDRQQRFGEISGISRSTGLIRNDVDL